MVVNLEINEQVCKTIAYDGAGVIGCNIFSSAAFLEYNLFFPAGITGITSHKGQIKGPNCTPPYPEIQDPPLAFPFKCSQKVT